MCYATSYSLSGLAGPVMRPLVRPVPRQGFAPPSLLKPPPRTAPLKKPLIKPQRLTCTCPNHPPQLMAGLGAAPRIGLPTPIGIAQPTRRPPKPKPKAKPAPPAPPAGLLTVTNPTPPIAP